MSVQHHINDLSNTINNLAQYTDLSAVEQVAKQMLTIEQELSNARDSAQLYNMREALFGSEGTDYTALKKLTDQFDPFKQFWTTAANWKKWQMGCWKKLKDNKPQLPCCLLQ